MFGLGIDNVILFGIALLNAFTAYMAYKARHDIHKVEVATNSMKDALVVSVGKEQFAAGETVAREAGEAKAAKLLERNKT